MARSAKPLAQIRADWGPRLWDRYIRSENDERAAQAGCTVDETLGQHVCQFAESFCRHSEGRWAGQPFAFTKWQRERIVMPLFSWVQPDGTRRFRRADLWVAKKNGKSALCSVLALYLLVGENVPGAKVYAAAIDRDQASLVFDACAAMVNRSPALKRKLEVVQYRKRITRDDASWLQALSAESAKHEGLKAHAVIVDEIHVFDERAKRLFEALRYADIASEQPLSFVISTAGEDDTGVGYEQYQVAKAVATDQVIDQASFALICEADKDDDPSRVATWRKANPMLGEIGTVAEMRSAYRTAKATPTRMATFERYRLNRWVKTGQPWLDMNKWGLCGGALPNLLGERCYAGIDCAAVTDMTSLALCFPLDDGEYAFRWWYWLPEEMTDGGSIVKREQRDQSPYRMWAEEDWLDLMPGNVADYDWVEQRLFDCVDKYDVVGIGFDPWHFDVRAAKLIATKGLPMVKIRQGYQTLSFPSKFFEKLVLAGKLRHGDNPISKVQASRVTTTTDPAGNIKPVKSQDGGKRWYRIDGIVAAIIALAVAEGNVDDGKSVYEERGLEIIEV